MNYPEFIKFENGKKGDITPLLKDERAFSQVVEDLFNLFTAEGIDKVVGIEAMGFIFAAPAAYLLNAGLVLVRKSGKLPGEVFREGLLEISKDTIQKGERVLIIDDYIEETGSKIKASITLVEKLGGIIVGIAVVVDNAEKEVHEFLLKYRYHFLIATH